MKPTRKVGASGIAGALTTVLVFFSASLGYPIPPEVASSLVLLIMFGVAYMTNDGPA